MADQVLGYSSKRAAVLGLSGEGFAPDEVAAKLGIGEAHVRSELRKAALRGTGGATRARRRQEQPDATKGWTQDKLKRASRLFGLAMMEVARALNVNPGELLRFGLNGVVPPITGTPDPDFHYEPRRALPAPEPEPEAEPPQPQSEPALEPEDAIEVEFVEVAAPAGKRRRSTWTQEQAAELQRLAGTMPAPQIAKQMGVALSSIYLHAKETGTSLVFRSSGWARKLDVERLRALAGTMPIKALAAELGCSESTLTRNATEQGISLAYRPAAEVRESQTSVPAVAAKPPIPRTKTPSPAVAAPRRVPAPAAGKTYRLEAAPGVWLHQSCEVMTEDKSYRWQGTGKQLAAVHERWPWTRKLKAVEVLPK